MRRLERPSTISVVILLAQLDRADQEPYYGAITAESLRGVDLCPCAIYQQSVGDGVSGRGRACERWNITRPASLEERGHVIRAPYLKNSSLCTLVAICALGLYRVTRTEN